MSSTKSNTDDFPLRLSNGARSAITVVLIIHLFCIFVSLTSNWVRSPLQSALQRVLAPYTQLLNLDLNFTPYHLTHAQRYDVDNFIEVDLSTGYETTSLTRFPKTNRFHGGKSYQRYQTLADVMVFQAIEEQDESISALAHAVSAHVVHEHQKASLLSINHDVKGVIRCRQHMLQSTDDLAAGAQNASDDDYFQTAYEADIQLDRKTGSILIHKRTREAGEVAPVNK